MNAFSFNAVMIFAYLMCALSFAYLVIPRVVKSFLSFRRRREMTFSRLRTKKVIGGMNSIIDVIHSRPWVFQDYIKAHRKDAIYFLCKLEEVLPAREQFACRVIMKTYIGKVPSVDEDCLSNFSSHVDKFLEFVQKAIKLDDVTIRANVEREVLNSIEMTSNNHLTSLVNKEQNYAILWVLSVLFKKDDYEKILENVRFEKKEAFFECRKMNPNTMNAYLKILFQENLKLKEFFDKIRPSIYGGAQPVLRQNARDFSDQAVSEDSSEVEGLDSQTL